MKEKKLVLTVESSLHSTHLFVVVVEVVPQDEEKPALFDLFPRH